MGKYAGIYRKLDLAHDGRATPPYQEGEPLKAHGMSLRKYLAPPAPQEEVPLHSAFRIACSYITKSVKSLSRKIRGLDTII